ncbi:MAG: alpha/beta hydrolase [Proteobacteria bacterium]|nr:alpha/beta hydrolase [Pseudomonadota bacterium]
MKRTIARQHIRGGAQWRPSRPASAVQLCLLLLVLVGCTGQSAQRVAQQAQFVSEVAQGDPFLHQLYLSPSHGKGVLHIYIEGDGRPWRTRKLVSLDPTPRTPLMLQLMVMDSAPSLYLGRPCYFNLGDPRCSAQWWTHWRYSETVVASLDKVIDQFASEYQGVALFGHSGGGALAMLLAARREDVRSVLTLAGNLDIDAWADYRGYSRLEGSLNPVLSPPLAPKVQQLHLIGERDAIITPSMLSRAVARQPSAELRVIADIDHACCWQKFWPAILAELKE